MRSRTALATVSLLVCVCAGSCVLGNDSDRPVLGVNPVWDASPGERFLPAGCKDAGVAWMTWEIQDEHGKRLKKSDGLEGCAPLDFVGLTPGTYQVVMQGYDPDEVKRWESTCDDLVLGRFDTLEPCNVEQIEPEDSGEGADAGVSDAGL